MPPAGETLSEIEKKNNLIIKENEKSNCVFINNHCVYVVSNESKRDSVFFNKKEHITRFLEESEFKYIQALANEEDIKL